MDLVALMNGDVVGTLSADRYGHARFVYDAAWQTNPDAVPLSLSLPLASAEHRWQVVEAVIWGLLPDNERVLQRWGQRFQVSPRNAVALLSHVGEDCAGAAQFVRPEHVDAVTRGARDQVEWLSDADLGRRLKALRRDAASGRQDDDPGQFSLAGAQPKIALLREDGRWGIPAGRIPTTHILKPPTGAFDGYAENEHFCLQLARAVGLTTCASSVLHMDDEIAICVERYDRVQHAGAWQRIHQEDICQALGVRPELKYQNDGGPSPRAIDELLRHQSTASVPDREAFLLALMFNGVIGGTDAHAKNYSLLLGADADVRLAPLYDISSDLPYDGIDHRKLRLAMKIGSNYRWHDVRLKDWIDQAQLMGFEVDVAPGLLSSLVSVLPDLAADVAREVEADGMSHAVVPRLVDEIAASSEKWRHALALFYRA